MESWVPLRAAKVALFSSAGSIGKPAQPLQNRPGGVGAIFQYTQYVQSSRKGLWLLPDRITRSSLDQVSKTGIMLSHNLAFRLPGLTLQYYRGI